MKDISPHTGEPHVDSVASRLNWLRAGVLGANDGIVSVAGIVTGVAGATAARGPILTAGVAGLVAGAMSMALGEYVSVSSQRDTERAFDATGTDGAHRATRGGTHRACRPLQSERAIRADRTQSS